MLYKTYCKRMLDIVFSLLMIPALITLAVLVAPLIMACDPGPVFYRAKRLGRDAKPFEMYKFRSMRVNAPDIRLEDGSTYNDANDPRLIRIGRFLREHSLDEVPQVINVLKGEMSLIGPRPDTLDSLKRYPQIVQNLCIRPGITGYSQAYFRNSVCAEEKIRQDAYYVQHCSFWLDTRIFFQTIATVLRQDNIYKKAQLSAFEKQRMEEYVLLRQNA